MPLNLQVKALLTQLAQLPAPDFSTATPQDIRAISDQPIALGPPPAVAHVEQLSISLDGRTIEGRLYIPECADRTPPLTLYYHGGGWVIGTLDTHDATCRALARASGSAILSIAYRRAPEHRYPAIVYDCYDALCWASAQASALGVDGSRLAVAGDSAGGNLAAAVAILARDRGGPTLRHQLLLYPVTDNDFSRLSYTENGQDGSFLSSTMMRWFWDQYLGETPPDQAPLATILRTPDLTGLPPATVIMAEFDPLRDEGVAYAERLQAAGVATNAAVAPGMIHGFFSFFEAVPDALPWIDKAGVALGQSLA